MTESGAGNGVLVSYLTLRRVVGTLGVALPVLLVLWAFALCACVVLLPSISDYYRLRTRDPLVGILFTIAWFLFAYRGYERQDDIAGDVACISALGVALFPSSGSPGEKVVHYASATALFLVLSYFSLVLFTKTTPGGVPTPQKRIRNGIYKTCGVIMLVCIVLIGVYHLFLQNSPVAAWKPVFWLESIALWAFGWSWFVKGETIFRDAT